MLKMLERYYVSIKGEQLEKINDVFASALHGPGSARFDAHQRKLINYAAEELPGIVRETNEINLSGGYWLVILEVLRWYPDQSESLQQIIRDISTLRISDEASSVPLTDKGTKEIQWKGVSPGESAASPLDDI